MALAPAVEFRITSAKSSRFTCRCVPCAIAASICDINAGVTFQGPSLPRQGKGVANVIVCPMMLENRPKAWSAQQSGIMRLGKVPTTRNLPKIADFGAPSSTFRIPFAQATRATASGVSRAPTCKFHHPGCKRKPLVSTRFTPSNMLCPVVKPCTVMVRETMNAPLHHFGWVSSPHGTRGGCNHAGTATAK